MRYRVHRWVSTGLGLSLLYAIVPTALQAADWQTAINECWNDNGRNSHFSCFLSDGVFRMSKSGKECVIEAVRAAQADNSDTALRWLMACQSGNGAARDEIRRAGNTAVDYAVDNYRMFVTD